ncbi:NucA/NucB deoxyribonuclease domain-containing protein [Streptomyces sp. enrichment culture]|uniref:NucA/NucB deoxyribonuclease domain-containing protein n=1 Tax=Streptomyces sp. enrichment culture TaxID=1795815 RepID=UPI003F5664B8
MKKRTTLICAAVAATAVFAGPFPQHGSPSRQDTVTEVAQTRDIQPQYATTANTTIRLKANITQEQIDKARERVKAGRAGSAPTAPKQTNERPKELDHKDAEALTLGEAYKLADQRNKEAQKHPYKDFGRDAGKATSGSGSGDKITMSPVAAYDLNESTVGYPVGTVPPADLEVKCFSGIDVFDVVIDRFSSCSRVHLIVDYYKVSSNQPPEHMGTTKAKVQFFQQQYNTARSMRIFGMVQKDSVVYDWGWWDSIWTAPGIDLTIVGNCIDTTNGCSATGSPLTMSWENWNSSNAWYHWNINSDETMGIGRDKQSPHRSHVEIYTDTGDYQTVNRGSFVERLIRCDSATYIYPDWPKGCVFLETIPRLMYSRAADSPQKDVADHIYRAQNAPDSTYPTSSTAKKIPGKYIEGSYLAPGLHRLHASFHQEKMDANTAHKDAACTSTGEYSLTGLPLSLRPDTANGEECDEYPFRVSLEGAASSDWDFSVQAVNGTQNGSAGQMLMIYMRNHRILAWDDLIHADYNDRYYVQIVDF